MKHLAFYSHFHFGLGHVSRTTAIINAVVEQDPDITCTLFADPLNKVDFFIHPNIQIVELPKVPVDLHDFTLIRTKIMERTQIIVSYFENHSIDVFLTDHMPYGMYDEFIDLFKKTIKNKWHTQFILGVPYPFHKRFAPRTPHLKKLLRLYSHAFIYSDQSWYDFEFKYSEGNMIQYHTGIITRPVAFALKNEEQRNLSSNKCIAVSVGSGIVGLELFEKVLQATRVHREHNVTLKWVMGPLGDKIAYEKLCIGEKNITLLTQASLQELTHDADVIIARAGYNSAFSLVRSRLPIIFIPYVGQDDEQEVRALRLSETVENIWILREHNSQLATKLEALIHKGLKAPLRSHELPFRIDGATQAAKYMIDLAHKNQASSHKVKAKKILTIHADDLGLTKGVTQGITTSITDGIVTDTAAMVCIPNAEAHITKVKDTLKNRIGLHLQLTGGTPCLDPNEVPTLVTSNGNFPHKRFKLSKSLDISQVEKEWEAQLKRLQSWGIQPAYVDSHHNVHLLPKLLPVIANFAKKHQLYVRSGDSKLIHHYFKSQGITSSEYTVRKWYGNQLSKEYLLNLIDEGFQQINNEGVLEIACHPGFSDTELEHLSTHNRHRETEINILTDKELPNLLAERGITLLSTHEITQQLEYTNT
ncbi:ChbG/HpnK family deacetylase [uncultured Dokdonia sp.]|uniref:ChbG/HpnK family deacetylase n=1 Tax=uncultured Dokdonia sp. TaxID=575653 RepID=UPI002639C8F5|nr:ChbG/HpnK family deacetylase [uncultured Dokdonia sp.]